MKKVISLLAFTLVSLLFAGNVSAGSFLSEVKYMDETDDAIEYNDKMIGIQADVDNSLVDLLDAIDTGKKLIINAAKKECLNTIKAAKKQVKKTGDFKGDDEYQLEMYAFLEMYEDIAKGEITDIIKFTLTEEELTDVESEKYMGLYDSALYKYEVAFEKFNAFQIKFSEKWDFIIEE